MGKRFTKIICAAVAAISASALAIAPACGVNWSGLTEKDAATSALSGTNGGFVTETMDYVYFINGKAANTDKNEFGSVLKGSVQRLKKSELAAGNYASSQTVVPSVVYSGSHDAGLYIYGGYIYYATPSTQRDTDGNVLNSRLDFKRTKLDGTDTTDGYIYQSTDNSIDYRFVEAGDKVYLIYALSENLYGTSATNVHSVNCETKEDTMLAYNVASYAFDTEDAENPYIYYTMKGTQTIDDTTDMGYNQLFRVRADVTESPREYDFSGVKDYDAEEDPVYVNFGDFVYDGIGKLNYESWYSQLNYGYPDGKDAYALSNDDYTYEIKSYKNGTLYYTRKGSKSDSMSSMFTLTAADIDKDNDGKVDTDWNAILKNAEARPFILGADTTEYEFVKMGEKLYAINAGTDGISKREVNANGTLSDALYMSGDASATLLGFREENEHLNLYYSVSGGNGYSINRIAVDGTEDDYRKLSPEIVPDASLTYRSVKVLDLDACSDWYNPEFVGNVLFFASETAGMSEYNYIMACDLSDGDGKMMTNKQIKAYNEQYEAVTEKYTAYELETATDGSTAYPNLVGALKYLFYTRDVEYLGELATAYVDINGEDENHIFNEGSRKIYTDFIENKGDWEKDDDGVAYKAKEINGEAVYSNTRDYYYSVVGRMTEADEEGLTEHFRTEDSMPAYPVDTSTWWEKLSTGGKVGFIIGMCAAGILVIGGGVWLTIYLVRRKKNASEEDKNGGLKVDLTDDKDVDVYGDGQEE